MWSTERLTLWSRVGNLFFGTLTTRVNDIQTVLSQIRFHLPNAFPPATTVRPNKIIKSKGNNILCHYCYFSPRLTGSTIHVSSIFFTKDGQFASLKKIALSCSLKSAFWEVFFTCFLSGVLDTSGKIIIIIYRFSNWNYARNHYTVSSSPNQQRGLFYQTAVSPLAYYYYIE